MPTLDTFFSILGALSMVALFYVVSYLCRPAGEENADVREGKSAVDEDSSDENLCSLAYNGDADEAEDEAKHDSARVRFLLRLWRR